MTLFKGRRSQMAISMAIFFVLFNVLLFIIISSFGMEGIDVGTSGGTSLSINSSTGADVTSAHATSWLGGFSNSLSNMPWWVNLFLVLFETGGLALTIYALIRGI